MPLACAAAIPSAVVLGGRIEATQIRAGSRCGKRTDKRRRMPALHLVVIALARHKLHPGFVARYIGRDDGRAAYTQRFSFRQNRRDYYDARMAACHIIVVENVTCGAVDPRGIRRRHALSAEVKTRFRHRRRVRLTFCAAFATAGSRLPATITAAQSMRPVFAIASCGSRQLSIAKSRRKMSQRLGQRFRHGAPLKRE